MDRKYKPALAVGVLILLVAVIGVLSTVIIRHIPTKEKMDLNEYYGEPADGEAALILGTEQLEERGLVDGDKIYLPLDVVNTYLNAKYYREAAR